MFSLKDGFCPVAGGYGGATIYAQFPFVICIFRNSQDSVDLSEFQPKTESKTEKEELMKGLVSVTKYDFKFLEIDVPEPLRKLKRGLRRDNCLAPHPSALIILPTI